MAVGPDELSAPTRRATGYRELFQGFRIAFDPRKLLAAAAGILAMALGWYALSAVFDASAPDRKDESRYGAQVTTNRLGPKKPNGQDYAEQDYRHEADRRYARDLAEWRTLHDLAGPGGRFRTMPWYEYRGPNPFLILSSAAGGTASDIPQDARGLAAGTLPVLVEPLFKLFLPAIKLFDPNANLWTRVYLILCLVWSVAVWAFFGGVITRIAAVQLGDKDRVSLMQAVRYVASRYTQYLLSPLVPLGIIAVIVVAMALYGFVALIPVVGDILLYGLGLPLVIFGGVAIAILLIGLVGYPLMFSTVSVEGSDTFDALSRSYNYVYQSPLTYLWYNLVSILYGSVCVLAVVFFGSLMVYLGKFAVSQAPLSEYFNRKPDFLFVYAPESFGWQELLLKGSPIEKHEVFTPEQPRTPTYAYTNPEIADAYMKDMRWYNYAGAGMATFWTVLVFMLVLGFSYSYFWSSATIIYLLMRAKVDETDFDEVYVEEPLPVSNPPATTAAVPHGPAPSAPGAISLPTTTPATPAIPNTTLGTARVSSLPIVPPAPTPPASLPVPPSIPMSTDAPLPMATESTAHVPAIVITPHSPPVTVIAPESMPAPTHEATHHEATHHEATHHEATHHEATHHELPSSAATPVVAPESTISDPLAPPRPVDEHAGHPDTRYADSGEHKPDEPKM